MFRRRPAPDFIPDLIRVDAGWSTTPCANLKRSPARDVPILAFAALLVVAAKREDIEVAMTTRGAIMIWPPPWIDQGIRTLEVGSAPVRNIRRRIHQRAKADLFRRIAPV